jgi:glycosyltransferase involved in cell wall biosynthesis
LSGCGAANDNVLRIIHLDTGRELRGGQFQLLMLARGLRDRGHEQGIVCPPASELERRARAEGFETLTATSGSMRSLARLRNEIQRRGAQILHAHDGRAQTLSAMGSLRLPVRRVATRRVVFMARAVAGRAGLHRIQYGPTCHAIIAVSEYVRGLLVRSGLDGAKIEVIHDGVEIPDQLPDGAARAAARTAGRRKWGIDPSEFVIGHAGAFTDEKGQEVLLEAFLRARGLGGGARLLLAGDGPLRNTAHIRTLVEQAEGRARLLDWMPSLDEFFAALDLYVMPSLSEGLGSSALLAMAHGLPVVASRTGGLTEVVAEGRTGWLTPPGSAPALAEALELAAAAAARLESFGSAGRERARKFSADIMITRTEALYLRLARTLPGAALPGGG